MKEKVITSVIRSVQVIEIYAAMRRDERLKWYM